MSGDWKDLGLCAEVDPDLWFPEQGKNAPAARLICRRCPVRAQCLEAGLYEEHGIWGGLTALQRRRLRHERDAA